MNAGDWLQLLLFHLSVSLLAVGGAVTLAPDLHRFLVDGRGWLSEAQFGTLTLAQVAPGPNVLFIALAGWNVGANSAAGQAGGIQLAFAALGMATCVVGALAPSSLLTLAVTRWSHRNRERLAVRAFRQGMAPIVVGVLLSTAWLLAQAASAGLAGWQPWILTAACTLLVWRTRLHLIWMLATGAALGAAGWI